MYESKEKNKEEPTSGKAVLGDSKEDTQKASEGTAELVRVYCPRQYVREGAWVWVLTSVTWFSAKRWTRSLTALDQISVFDIEKVAPAQSLSRLKTLTNLRVLVLDNKGWALGLDSYLGWKLNY